MNTTTNVQYFVPGEIQELSTNELTTIQGGGVAVLKEGLKVIGFSYAYDLLKAAGESRSYKGDPVTTYDDPPGGYHGA
jgi:bacteriocin-like protein